MLATNMAPVSLSRSLFSVTMYNLGSSPPLLTKSLHITSTALAALPSAGCHSAALSESQGPIFAINAVAAPWNSDGGGRCLLSRQEIIGGGTGTSLTARLIYTRM